MPKPTNIADKNRNLWGMPCRIRADAHARVRAVSDRYRLSMSDAFDVIAQSWDLITEAQRLALIQREPVPGRRRSAS